MKSTTKEIPMTARYGTKCCVECGERFAKSRTDATVRCPACRARKTHAPRTKRYTEIECSRCGTYYTTLKCTGCGF